MTKSLQSLAQEGRIIIFFSHSKASSTKSAFISKYNLRSFLSVRTFWYCMRDDVLNNLFRNGTNNVHCTTLKTGSDLCIPRYETARPRSQFIHSCIYRSHIHECSNWERARADSFLGIFVSNFRYSAGCGLPPPPPLSPLAATKAVSNHHGQVKD
jgi:hypothetical protein